MSTQLHLKAALESIEQSRKDIQAALDSPRPPAQADPLRVTGYAFPVTPPEQNWYLTQRHDWNNGAGHTGLDINLTTGGDTDLGQPVFSTCNGVVIYARQAPGEYWGNLVVTMSQDDDGLLFWRYAHLDKVQTFTGARVLAGEQIGTIGKGGRDRYWAHLHLDAWRGEVLSTTVYRTRQVRWIDPLVVWQLAGYRWDWGVRK